jgi:uncharacterized protein
VSSNNADLLESTPGPIRTCVGCRSKRPQHELLRVANVAGQLRFDRLAPGRGAWICLARAARSKGFDRTLRTAFPAAVVAAFVSSFEKTPQDVAD